MSRIDLNIVATGQFSQVESALARLRAQIAALNAQSMRIGGISPEAIRSVQAYTDSFNASIDRSGMFERHMVNMTTETERFGRSLQQGRLRLSDYSRAMREYRRDQMGQIKQLAREQVRMMNATTMMMPDGRAQVIVPRGIDEAIDKQSILNQEYRIFRQTVQGASTQLINWGKNTQWAGRQLTVGLTVPLTIFGATAGKMFMDVDKELTRLGKVYGGTAGKIASPTQVAAIREQTQALAQELAASMGIAAQETAGLAADIAATGAEGADLISATRESVRLSVLGEVDRQEAMRATLAIQSVFKKSNEELADSINFLNSVENQTSTTLNDLVTGIVKAGPVVEGLGGSIEDLAMMMVAMREGGVPAAEAANAIKSSMGSLINPTKVTSEQFKEMGINLKGLVDKNAGDLIGTLKALQNELGALDDLSRQRAIEQLFGKYQFARINALLNNLGRAGSQTEEVVKLTQLSVEQLAKTAENELKVLTESTSMRFKRALESLKANLVPIGETFVKIGTVLLEIGNKVFEIFNSLPEPVQNFVKGLGLLVGIAGPIIMITGVMGNFFGYIVKGVSALLALKRAGRGVFEFFTPESVAAKTASELLTGAVYSQTEAFDTMNAALEILNQNLKEMTNNLNAAGGASGTMAARTMAAAEAAAASSGAKQVDLIPGMTFGSSKYGGFERSHIISGLGENTPEYGRQTSAVMLAPTMTNAREFQRAAAGWTASFYDPSSGMSRAESLINNPTVGPSAKQYIPNLSPEELQRLAPTRQEYQQAASSYLAALKVLVNDTSNDVREQLRAAKGDPSKFRSILQAALADNNGAYQRYMQEISTSLSQSGDSFETMARAAMTQEAALTANAPALLRGTNTGRGTNALIYAIMGGGVAQIEGAMTQAAQQIVNPIGMNARQLIADGRRAGMKLSMVTTASGKKYIVDFTNGVERATVYTVDSATGAINKALSGVTRDRIMTNPATTAAIARYNAAVDRLDIMTQADINHSAAVTNAAAGQATPGVPVGRTPGRFSNFMSGAGGMGLMGGMSALSMLGGATQDNSALSILGATGMGASLGMMAGPKGAAAGAAIGALAGTVMSAKSNMDGVRENAKKLADSMSIGASSLTSMAEFFGGTLLSDRASAQSVIDGTGLREEQLTQAQEYLATDAGKTMVEGFSSAMNSYGFNRAVEGMGVNLGNMIMQGAISFENAQGISAALAEQLQMPELSASITGQLTKILGPDGQDITRKPITVAVKLQQQSAETLSNITSSVISDQLGNIEATGMQRAATAALGAIGPVVASFGQLDIPGVSGVVRDLTGFVNSDYAGAVSSVTLLGRTIGNQLRSSYESLNSAVFRYNQLEEEALSMKKGPERRQALNQLEKEKAKIDELRESYEAMKEDAKEGFAKLVSTDAGLAAESLGAMSESLKEMFSGTMEAPALEALLGTLSGMDQNLQMDIMLNVSSGELSPTAVMSMMNLIGDKDVATKNLQIILETHGVEGANKFMLDLMMVEDETIRKQLLLQYTAEADPQSALAMEGLTDNRRVELETAANEAEAEYNRAYNEYVGMTGEFETLTQEQALALITSYENAADGAIQALLDFDARRNEILGSNPFENTEGVIGPWSPENLKASAETSLAYVNNMSELAKLDITPKLDLRAMGESEGRLRNINEALDELLAMPDELVKHINIDDLQSTNAFAKFERKWENTKGKTDIQKAINLGDGFSENFEKFGLSYEAFAALPNIVKYAIMYYIQLLMTIEANIKSVSNANPGREGPEAAAALLDLQTQRQQITDTIKGIVGNIPGLDIPSGGGTSTGGSGGDSGGGSGGGKEEDKYKKLIDQQNKLIDGIRKEREERERIARLQEESLNFMLDQQALQNDIARAKAEGNFAEAALLQAKKDIEKEQRDRELAEDARQRAEDKEIAKREQIIEILEKGGKFADKLAAALNKLDGRIPSGLLRGRGGKKKADGGPIFGPGGPKSDVIPAMLSNGEFVMQADAVDKYGLPFMYMINNKTLPAFGGGGYSSRYPGMAARMYRGGLARKMYGSSSNESIEYNINVTVAGSNSSADEIAAEVLKAMQRRERMNRSVTRI